MKKAFIVLGIVVAIAIVAAASLYMIYLRPVMQKMKTTAVVQYDPQLTLILGGGGNTGILTSDSLVIVVDTKMDEAAEKLYETVKQMAGNKPILVINTHWHSDHCGGNKYYANESILAGGDYTVETWTKEAGKESLPTRWLKGKMDIKMGDETVTILNLGKTVHTPSDVMVYLHKRKMLFGGDVILNKQAPAILGTADPEAYLWAFEWVPTQFAIEHIVPGHGPIGGVEVIDNFKTFFNDMKLAANDPSQEDQLVSKYDDWTQVPGVMSPGSTIRAFNKKMNK